MRYVSIALMLALMSPCGVAEAADGVFDLNLNLIVGQKQVDEDDWGADLEKQILYGVMADVRPRLLPFSIALDILASQESADVSGEDFTGKTYEIDVGLRKYFNIVPGPVTPFVGGGLAIINADIEGSIAGSEINDSGVGYGYWLDAGLVLVVGERFNIGAAARYSDAEADLDSATAAVDEIKAGGVILAAFAGITF